MIGYDWDAHWAQLAAKVVGREDEVVKLALVLHVVFDGYAWGTGELDCWCGDETPAPAPDTNCWRLAAAILVETPVTRTVNPGTGYGTSVIRETPPWEQPLIREVKP